MKRIFKKTTLLALIVFGLFASFWLYNGHIRNVEESEVSTELVAQRNNVPYWPRFEEGLSHEYVVTINGKVTVKQSSRLLSKNPLEERFIVSDHVEHINADGVVDLALKYDLAPLDMGSGDISDTLHSSMRKGTGHIHIAEDGTIKTSTLPDSMIGIPGILQKQLAVSQMYLSRPPEGLEVGDVWRVSYTYANGDKDAGGEETVNVLYTLVGHEDYHGCSCTKFEVELESHGSYPVREDPLIISKTRVHGFIYFNRAQKWPFAQTLDLTWIGSSKITETTLEFSLEQLPTQLAP